MSDGRCYFRSDADSHVVRGLVGLLTDFYSGIPPAELETLTLDPVEQLGLNKSLSPTRRHGLAAVLSAIRQFGTGNAMTLKDRCAG